MSAQGFEPYGVSGEVCPDCQGARVDGIAKRDSSMAYTCRDCGRMWDDAGWTDRARWNIPPTPEVP